MAKKTIGGNSGEILLREGIKDEKLCDKFLKNLSKEDLEEKKLTNIAKIFMVMKEILQ